MRCATLNAPPVSSTAYILRRIDRGDCSLYDKYPYILEKDVHCSARFREMRLREMLDFSRNIGSEILPPRDKLIGLPGMPTGILAADVEISSTPE